MKCCMAEFYLRSVLAMKRPSVNHYLLKGFSLLIFFLLRLTVGKWSGNQCVLMGSEV